MKRTLRTNFGKSKLYSAHPEAYAARKTAPVFVVPGFSETIAHSKELVEALADHGFTAETFSPPRKSDKESRRINDAIQRQGNVVLSVLEAAHPNAERVHAMGHSLGAAAVLRAAIADPERFESITLMQPLGMTGNKTLAEMAFVATKKTIKNQIEAFGGQDPTDLPEEGYAARIDSETGLHYAKRVAIAQSAAGRVLGRRPLLTYKEAAQSGEYEIYDDIAKVNELGIPVHVVTAYGDDMFDYAEVEATHSIIGDHAASHSTIADKSARHDAFWLQPERTAEIMSQIVRE